MTTIMRLKACLLFAVCVVSLTSLVAVIPANATVHIVAAVPELADIAAQVGGNLVSVDCIAKPNQDYHMIEPRPSDVSRISRADMVVRIGLDLDLWLDALLNAAGNRKVGRGGPGYVDASEGISKLEVPQEAITGASGDIHVYGNPHYFYDPMNGEYIAYNIARGLARVSPSNAATFSDNYLAFNGKMDRLIVSWRQQLAPYKGQSVVTYHQSAIYFLRRFGLKQFGTLEVKPEIPPSAAHVQNLIGRMKSGHVKALVIESVYPRSYADLIVRETGARLEITPYSVGSMGTRNYFELIGKWVAKYKEALQ